MPAYRHTNSRHLWSQEISRYCGIFFKTYPNTFKLFWKGSAKTRLGHFPVAIIALCLILAHSPSNISAADDRLTTGKPIFYYDKDDSAKTWLDIQAYPSDPPANIPWPWPSIGYSGVADIQSAFNNARIQENAQLGTSVPMLTLPTQTTWNNMTEPEKALWLINRERIDRGITPLHGLEKNVTEVAQYYAQYLFDHDAFSHDADGNSPWGRLDAKPAIAACRDFLNVAENLAVFVTSGTSIPLPVERSIYAWMYDDSGSSWGHRHAILWYPYNDNSGTSGMEGFLGIGQSSGGPYQGPFSSSWNHAEIVVMNVFDPCSAWAYIKTKIVPLAPIYNLLLGQ